MARIIFVLLCCQLASLPTLAGKNDDENPFMDLAGALLQNMGDGGGLGGANGLAALGGLVGTLMQGDNAKNLGSMLGQGNNAGDVLSGLGSLLTNQNGQIDPAMIGTVINMFAQQNTGNGQGSQRKKRENTQDNELGIDNIMSAVSGLLDGKNAGEFLPVLVNTLSSFSGAQADQKAHEHEDHAKFLPPYLEKAHLYWDLFINSELGKAIWEKMGVNKIVKAFQDKDGKVSFEKMLKNLENHSFRRHWIKVAAKYMTESVVHLAKPEVYQSYVATGQYVLNGFLESQGFPRKTHFNSARPEESLTALSNYIVKKYLDADTDISMYVKPAVAYVKQILSMAKTTGQSILSKTDYNALADRLTDTLNLEVIEPVMRVYRAYKHSMEAPHCQEHLMCLVNRNQDGKQKGAPGFKAGLTKLSSFVASAALSFQNGKGFWDLYNAIQNDVNCDAHYPADCAAFHEHEMKVTTEIYHNEL